MATNPLLAGAKLAGAKLAGAKLAPIEKFVQNCHGGRLRIKLLLTSQGAVADGIRAEFVIDENAAPVTYTGNIPFGEFAELKCRPEDLLIELLSCSRPQPKQETKEPGVFLGCVQRLSQDSTKRIKLYIIQWTIKAPNESLCVVHAALRPAIQIAPRRAP